MKYFSHLIFRLRALIYTGTNWQVMAGKDNPRGIRDALLHHSNPENKVKLWSTKKQNSCIGRSQVHVPVPSVF